MMKVQTGVEISFVIPIYFIYYNYLSPDLPLAIDINIFIKEKIYASKKRPLVACNILSCPCNKGYVKCGIGHSYESGPSLDISNLHTKAMIITMLVRDRNLPVKLSNLMGFDVIFG